MIVLDASVLIAHLDAADAQHGLAVERLLGLVEHAFACSAITLAEVFAGPARHGRLELARDAVEELGVRPVGLAAGAAVRLATLHAETGLKLPDCCVLLTAQDERAAGVLTFDGQLARAASALGLEA